jgi:hypothetical protein
MTQLCAAPNQTPRLSFRQFLVLALPLWQSFRQLVLALPFLVKYVQRMFNYLCVCGVLSCLLNPAVAGRRRRFFVQQHLMILTTTSTTNVLPAPQMMDVARSDNDWNWYEVWMLLKIRFVTLGCAQTFLIACVCNLKLQTATITMSTTTSSTNVATTASTAASSVARKCRVRLTLADLNLARTSSAFRVRKNKFSGNS